MNMPSAMAAKPTQVLSTAERLVLGADPHPQDGEVQDREDDGVPDQAERSGSTRISPITTQIVRVGQVAIGAAGDQPLAGNDDDARGPARPQGRQHPHAQSLQDDEEAPAGQGRARGRCASARYQSPASHSVCESDDQRIVLRRHFDRAAFEKPGGVAAGEDQFAQALQRDERQDKDRQRHAARARDSTPAREARPHGSRAPCAWACPAATTRSSTNRTVGADMLP